MNARDNIKPKSIRVAILQALADGAITTIDDLQIKMDERREKIANNVYPAAAEGLIKRMRDDVTGGAAYQILPKGRELLAKYASGKVEVLADVVEAEKPTVRENRTVAAESEKSVITPGVKVDVSAVIEQKDLDISRLKAQDQMSHDLIVKLTTEITEWLGMAQAFGCATPQEIANKFSELAGIITAVSAKPVGYILNRPGQPMKRFSKAETAKARALSFARGYGIRSQAKVFALHLVGTAVPGAEWKKA